MARSPRALGTLPDGTPYHVQPGSVVHEGDLVLCHLCGEGFRSLVPHLRVHGWTRLRYVEAFALEYGVVLEGDATRAKRSAEFEARRLHERPLREGIDRGHELARSGELAELAAKAARGRRHPEQRRVKTLAGLAAIPADSRVDGLRRARRRALVEAASRAAARFGYDDLDGYVADGLAAGRSLAELSRTAGFHTNWLQRHLAVVAPRVAERQASLRCDGADRRWAEVLDRLGYPDLATYLTQRHVHDRLTVHALAVETRRSRDAVVAALVRHGITPQRQRTRTATSDAR
jgi:hypothetical protein